VKQKIKAKGCHALLWTNRYNGPENGDDSGWQQYFRLTAN
jgi:hypothetical protein